MASGRLRLNRNGSQSQLPPAKSARTADERGTVPLLETTSHWILNDKLIGQVRLQAGGTASGSSHLSSPEHRNISDLSSSISAQVIVVSSSQEDSSASESSFISQDGCIIDIVTPALGAGGAARNCGDGRRVVPAAVPAHCDDDGLIASDEQCYTFGEEEEFLSQAAVARWQQGPEALVILDDDSSESSLASPRADVPSPAQELLAYLTLHNLNALQPTLLAHEVSSISCMCMLTHSDIACAAPRLRGFGCTAPPHRFFCRTLGISSEAVRLRLMAAIVALRKQILARASDGPGSSVLCAFSSASANSVHQTRDLPYLQLQTQPGGVAIQQRDISSFFRPEPAAASIDDTDEYPNALGVRCCMLAVTRASGTRKCS